MKKSNKRSLFLIFALAAIVCLLAFAVSAEDINGVEVVACIGEYGEVGTTYYATLGEAIDAAEDDDVITLFDDTSEGVITFSKSITIQGQNNPTATLSLHPSNCTLELSGFTISYSGHYYVSLSAHSSNCLVLLSCLYSKLFLTF